MSDRDLCDCGLAGCQFCDVEELADFDPATSQSDEDLWPADYDSSEDEPLFLGTMDDTWEPTDPTAAKRQADITDLFHEVQIDNIGDQDDGYDDFHQDSVDRAGTIFDCYFR